MVGPRKESKESHHKTITGKVNGKVTRTRTGCLTCRERRKKCDERKPGCRNCERAGYICEGYTPKIQWKQGRRAQGSGTAEAPGSDSMGLVAMNSDTAVGGRIHGELLQYGTSQDEIPPYFQQSLSAPSLFKQSHAPLANFEEDDALETVYTQLSLPQHSGSSLEYGSAYFPGGYGDMNPLTMFAGGVPFVQLQIPEEFERPSPLPKALPYPVRGIETSIQKKMFHHFTTVLSPLLTTSNGISAPMNSVVVPLAVEDRTLMKTLLSLAGSHMLNKTVADQGLATERDRLHLGAVEMQTRRTQLLLATDSASRRDAYSVKEQDTLLATSILLCLYGICIGSKDSTCQNHLDMARESITLLSSKPNDFQPREAVERIVTEVDPLLLEFFVYHDGLADVTFPSCNPKPEYVLKPGVPRRSNALVGDGIMHFINRIAPLRVEKEIGIAIVKAASISDDLESWKPPQSSSKDHKMIAGFYRWALSIWLYSILYPERKADAKIQEVVPSIMAEMSNISDDVKACLLFPLFIVGGAVIEEEHRNVIRGLFRNLREWSSLGNIDVALSVVENMWRGYDGGLPKAWDWVSQLEKCGMTLLVT